MIAALAVTFLLCCVIYYAVPKGHVPWHGVWPGALFVTVTTGIANAVYPFYLAQVSSVGEVGGTIGFVLIAMVWFYLVSLGLMAGAVINALRYELRDTGEPRGGAHGGVEDLAWAGIAVAAEAATLGVRLLSRAVEAVRKPPDRR